MGQRKDHMKVADAEQLFGAGREPLVAGVGLALWAVPRTAGVEGGGFIATSATAVQVATRSTRTGSFYEAVAMRTNDIGHLEEWRFHFLCNFRERLIWSGLETSMVSNGLPADRK